jgi:hypothetical protein
VSWLDGFDVRLSNVLRSYAHEIGMDPNSPRFAVHVAYELVTNGHKRITNLGRKSMTEILARLSIEQPPPRCPTCRRTYS